MVWRPEYPRRIPERRPAGHQPRAPRWSALFEMPVAAVTSDYMAIQVEDSNDPAIHEFLLLAAASTGVMVAERPDSAEVLMSLDASGFTNVIHLGYWTDPVQHARWTERSELGRWFRELQAASLPFGAWHEVLQVPIDRVETVYSSPKKEFGLAACGGVDVVSTTLNGYYGAARDRLPISAIDSLDAPAPHVPRRTPAPSRHRRLRASLGLNTTVIRSGQFWQNASGAQLDDYEDVLEPKMLRGMEYLSNNRSATGTLSLRILRSVNPEMLLPRRETSVFAYFHSLSDLEDWAASHATHEAIYEHAIAKNREYGDQRTVTTWHEVFVLTESSSFEYVNCHPSTGVLEFARHLWEAIDE